MISVPFGGAKGCTSKAVTGGRPHASQKGQEVVLEHKKEKTTDSVAPLSSRRETAAMNLAMKASKKQAAAQLAREKEQEVEEAKQLAQALAASEREAITQQLLDAQELIDEDVDGCSSSTQQDQEAARWP